MWRCKGCHSIHCKEDADLKAYYAHYPLKEQRLDFHTRLGYRRRLALLRQQGVRPSHRILDFGCSNGVFVEFLRSHGYDKAFGYDTFVQAYRRPERLTERYDTIVSYDVIEHDEDPRGFLLTLTNLLNLKGLLVIGTPNAAHLSLERVRDPGLLQKFS
jgi:2-polyprenyl-3-methyl-5-hydroxy-6-metoxy-1,4-benzoquinol methylase